MSDDGGVHDRFGCQPITLDDSYVCVWNGEDKEPCALQVYKVGDKKMVQVKRTCPEWCRLLASKSAARRPLGRLQIWDKWKVATEEGIESMKTKKRTHERLEATEATGGHGSKAWQRVAMEAKHGTLAPRGP